MPTPFMHLQIANQLLTRLSDCGQENGRLHTLLTQQQSALFFGSIAPDFPAICDLPRIESHFYAMPPAPDHDAFQEMLLACPQLANGQELAPVHAVFIAAYGAHLMFDLIWFRDIVMPWIIAPKNLGERPYRQLLHFALLTYLDELAFASLTNTAVSTLSTSIPNNWLPFTDNATLIQWRDLVGKQLQPGATLETIPIFAARLQLAPETFAAYVHDQTWMQTNLFDKLPIDKIQETLKTAVPLSIDCLSHYLR
ncbi:MAG: hypothetical protein GY943_23850 [Chloroflexi bacterium]|nr:hypothetical protein [Chloroflexota bacterium]